MLGAMLSLGAAFFWASSVILFKICGETFSPISLNIFKCLIALILISLTMLVLNINFFPAHPVSDWILLAASGIIGITLADIFFFIALNRLGAGLTAIVECLYLPSVIFFSFLLLNENLTSKSVIGGILVFTAVLVGTVSAPNKNQDKTPKLPPQKTPWSGIFIGCLSMVCVALGIVMIKDVLEQSNVFWATLVRLAAGTVSLFFLLICHPRRKIYMTELNYSRAWKYAIPASIFGNYFALLCWLGGMKFTSASRAAILNQMSTIFIFILAALFLNERITANRLIAIGLALTGAGLTISG